MDTLKYKINNFITKGQLVPSSRFLVDRMVSRIDLSQEQDILQLGFGTGVFSKEILQRMSPASTITIFEVREACRAHKALFEDARITYIEDSAEHISTYFPLKKFDCIVSTLPFTHFPKDTQRRIYSEIKQCLSPTGTFLQYQYSLRSKKDISALFDLEPSVHFELYNLPPAFIYEVKLGRNAVIQN